MRYLDELDSAIYEGDTVQLKHRTERLLEVAAHHRIPRMVNLIETLAESAESCDLGLSIETMDAIRRVFRDLDAGGIGSPNLPRADRNILS